MNSVLQILLNSKEIQKLFLDKNPEAFINYSNSSASKGI